VLSLSSLECCSLPLWKPQMSYTNILTHRYHLAGNASTLSASVALFQHRFLRCIGRVARRHIMVARRSIAFRESNLIRATRRRLERESGIVQRSRVATQPNQANSEGRILARRFLISSKMRQIRCPETSVTYQPTPRGNPEERTPQLTAVKAWSLLLLHIVLRLGMCGTVARLPHTHSWCCT
jgi:hypothetical protein